MPLPVLGLLAFAGLLGARELGHARGKRRERAQEQTGFQAAFDALAQGEQTQEVDFAFGNTFGFEPAGVSQQFTQQQLQAAQGLSISSPEVGFNQLLAFADANQKQANSDRQFELQNSQLGLQRDTFALNEQKFTQDKLEFQNELTQQGLELAVTQQEIADANRALIDPAFAMQQAAKDGRVTYPVTRRDPQTGQASIEIAPMPGTAPFVANQEEKRKTTDLLQNMNVIRGTVQRVGIQGDPSLLTTRDMQSRITAVHLELKNLAELGVLSGSDLDLLLRQFPDATSFIEWATSNPEALDAAMAQASRAVEGRATALQEQQSAWGGTNQRENARTQANLQAAQALNQGTAQRVSNEQQALTALDQLENTGFFGRRLDVVRSAFGQDQEAATRRLELLEFGREQAGFLPPGFGQGAGVGRQGAAAALDIPSQILSLVGGFAAGRL